MNHLKVKKRMIAMLIQLILLIGVVIILIPLYITVVTALKSPEDSTLNFFGLPNKLYLQNFVEVMSNSKFSVYFLNSFMITFVSVLCILLIVPIVSYAIHRNGDKRTYRFLYAYLVAGIFVPFQIVMVALVQMLTRLGLMNQCGLILCYVSYSLMQGVFLYCGYLKSIPRELEEAACVDGCGAMRSFFQIILPITKPMIATITILNVLWIWNDFQLPLMVLNKSSDFWTLPLYQYNFKSQYSFDYNLACASFMFSIIPMAIIYVFLQKYIIEGLTSGAVKG